MKYIKRYETADKWDTVFFKEAILWSEHSHDIQTQCGCVLVKDKTSISTGYNGFIRDIDDTVLPRVRPAKYPFMIHAEANAIYNSTRLGRSTFGATAYITGPPCINCLQMLYQCGINEIKFTDISNIKMDIFTQDYEKILKLIGSRLNIYFVDRELIFR